MVFVEALDVCAHLVDPGGDGVGCALVGSRQVAHAVGSAARLVGEFPGHDCVGVFVALDDGFDVFLECGLDLGVAVEVVMVLST